MAKKGNMRTIITKIPDHKTFYRGEQTIEIGYPWLTFGAIMALEHILREKEVRRNFVMLEMGSGGSTLFFANKVKSLISLEHDARWGEKVQKVIPSNVTYYCRPVPDLLRFINQEPDGYYDMILADLGSSYKERSELMNASISKLKKGGWMIIDNYRNCHFDYATGWDVYTFDMFRYSGRGTRLCKKL